MVFNWIQGLMIMCVLMVPCSAFAAVFAFVDKRPWLATVCALMFFACIFVLGGLPEEMWQ